MNDGSERQADAKEQYTSTPDDVSSNGATDLYIDLAAKKGLLLKLDLYLAPVMTLIFLAAYLDRANVGNAASAGMTTDLKLTTSELGSKTTSFDFD